MFEKMLIEHCSPTLGGIKTANLFSFPLKDTENFDELIVKWNEQLNYKGVSLHKLGIKGERVLVYVCRKSKLKEDLQKEGVQDFLKVYGYQEFSATYCIENLKKRLVNSAGIFPHEIGLFLGYPIEDVKGFIENSGKNSKCVGYWKVYNNENEAVKLFNKFNKCRKIYTELYEKQARSINQLTVAVS